MNRTFLTLSIASCLIFSGCAQQRIAKEKVENEIREVPPQTVKTETTREFIINSDKLSQVQKNQLLELQENFSARSSSLKEQIEKTKVVLIQTVLDPEMNEREFNILKKRITKLERERMQNGFDAIKEARNIIQPKTNGPAKDFYKAYVDDHMRNF